MPATPTQVVTGLKNRLALISGLRTFSYQPPQINPPQAFPVINNIRYHRAMAGGYVEYDVTCYVIVGRYTDDRAFAALDEYLAYSGNKSIRQILEGDETLGGTCQSLTVASSVNISSVNQADAEFLQIAVSVTVNG
jgi:hypothetical protein